MEILAPDQSTDTGDVNTKQHKTINTRIARLNRNTRIYVPCNKINLFDNLIVKAVDPNPKFMDHYVNYLASNRKGFFS